MRINRKELLKLPRVNKNIVGEYSESKGGGSDIGNNEPEKYSASVK